MNPVSDSAKWLLGGDGSLWRIKKASSRPREKFSRQSGFQARIEIGGRSHRPPAVLNLSKDCGTTRGWQAFAAGRSDGDDCMHACEVSPRSEHLANRTTIVECGLVV